MLYSGSSCVPQTLPVYPLERYESVIWRVLLGTICLFMSPLFKERSKTVLDSIWIVFLVVTLLEVHNNSLKNSQGLFGLAVGVRYRAKKTNGAAA